MRGLRFARFQDRVVHGQTQPGTPLTFLPSIMESNDMTSGRPGRRPYAAPRLRIYGSLQELTLTATVSKNKNDAVQGGNNLKT